MKRFLPPRDPIAVIAALLAPLWLAGCTHAPDWRHALSSLRGPQPADRFVLARSDTDVVGDLQFVRTRKEDTLPDIARRYDLGYDEIVAANPGVDPWLPGEGTRVTLPTAFVLPPGSREGIVLNLASKRLFYFPQAAAGKAAEVITHPVGIGREGWLTPTGTLPITQKLVNPAWTVPESVRREHAAEGDPLPPVVPPGPDNPLGDFAMRLSQPNYLIHGTNKPYGVGMRVSHGCVRLYPEDIASLFPQVPIGTPVRIINQPYLVGWRDGTLYLEAHEPLSEDTGGWNGSVKQMEALVKEKLGDRATVIDWAAATTVAREARGIPVAIAPAGARSISLLTGAGSQGAGHRIVE